MGRSFVSMPKSSLKNSIIIGVNCKLTLSDAHLLANSTLPVLLSADSHSAMIKSYQFLKNAVDQRIPVYGVNTNFGDQSGFLDPHLKDDSTSYYKSIQSRQVNIIRSLSCGLGNIVPSQIIKITMMLRSHCLAQGYSGVHPTVVDTILNFLNTGITPVVRKYGSIGASGDLIPLAMIAAGMLGEKVDVMYQDQIMKAPDAIKKAGLKPLNPELRDGLAIINGTSFMTAIASLALYQLKRLFTQMLSVIAMSLESMLVISSAYDPLVHQIKNQKGENIVNDFLLNFWAGSQLLSDLETVRAARMTHTPSKTEAGKSVQDYYSLRAVSQGFGPFQETLEKAIDWIENEMNSVNDNPIIDAVNNKVHHSANFMGYYVTDACDLLKQEIAQASTWLHALLANMIHPRKNHELPANLVPDPGVNNGFRSMQLLAAALAVQNRKLAQSQQAYTLPTEGDNQDVNSLGTHSAFDFTESVANLERLTAILLLASTQALELRGIEKASKKAQSIYKIVREYSPALIQCHPMSDELNNVIKILSEEKI